MNSVLNTYKINFFDLELNISWSWLSRKKAWFATQRTVGHSNQKCKETFKIFTSLKNIPSFSHTFDSKVCYHTKYFKFYAPIQKCHFGNFSIFPKWHFSTGAWNLKIFWPKVFFWSIMKMPIRKNIHNMSQGPPNPGFMQEKVQKGDFLKKPLRELNFFVVLGSYESLEGLEH